jgi:chemotaxis protein CheZ
MKDHLSESSVDNTGAAETDKERYERLYLEVGRLTRALHNAIRDFHLDIGLNGNPQVEHELSEMADARSRLGYVIGMTEDAANKTMDMVDEAVPVIQNMVSQSDALRDSWQQYVAKQPGSTADAALFGGITVLLDTISKDGSDVHGHLTEILMAQGYQDLSGQVIKRVIGLVSDVERSLVNLVKLASSVEQVAGIESPADLLGRPVSAGDTDKIRAEGPQVSGTRGKEQQKPDVVSGQDDVDDLLSSLGF